MFVHLNLDSKRRNYVYLRKRLNPKGGLKNTNKIPDVKVYYKGLDGVAKKLNLLGVFSAISKYFMFKNINIKK